MSIFSKIKGAKKAAKEHKNAEAQKTPAENVDKPQPYRHIPTHAAADALSGAPFSFREEDRTAIRESHKRRSQHPLTRNSSAYSANFAGNRSSSYNGSDWSHHNSFGNYGMSGITTPAMIETRRSFIGKPDYQPSPLASHAVSPTHSDHSTSSSSSQLVEMPLQARREPQLTACENLHKDRTRRVGEAPMLDSPPQRMTPQAVTATVTPKQPKKRSWGMGKFGKSTAISAH